MEYTIEKSVEFEYGHRLPGHKGKCRFWHGHSATVNVRVGGITKLRDDNMVVDFGELKEFLNIVNETYDHRLLVDINDPLKSADYGSEQGILYTTGQPTAELIASNILEVFIAWLEDYCNVDYGWLEVDFFEGPKSKITVRHERG